jgi:hypothetical protein
MTFANRGGGVLFAIALFCSALSAQQSASTPGAVTVPRLLNYSGKAADAQGKNHLRHCRGYFRYLQRRVGRFSTLARNPEHPAGREGQLQRATRCDQAEWSAYGSVQDRLSWQIDDLSAHVPVPMWVA